MPIERYGRPRRFLSRFVAFVVVMFCVGIGRMSAQSSWVVPAADVDLTGETAYWVRYTGGSGKNLSTTKPTVGDAGWKTTDVSIMNEDLSDLSQVFHFNKVGSKIYMYTQNADGSSKTYIGSNTSKNEGWDMKAVTKTDATLPNGQGYLRRIDAAGSTNNVYFVFARESGATVSNKSWLLPNRGTVSGATVFDAGGEDNRGHDWISQWVIIPWKPLDYLKKEIDEVQALVTNAVVGTSYNQISAESFSTTLNGALTTANTAYTTIKAAVDGGTSIYDKLSDIQAAWSALRTAKNTFLTTAYNAIDTSKKYVLVNKNGQRLKWSENASPAISYNAPALINENEVVTLAQSDSYYTMSPYKSSSQYLQMGNDSYQNQQLYGNAARWGGSPGNSRHQFEIHHLDATHVGIYFHSHIGFKQSGVEMENRAYLNYDYKTTSSPYNLRADVQETLNNPSAYWILQEVADEDIHTDRTYTYKVIAKDGTIATTAQVTSADGVSPEIPEVISTSLLSLSDYHYYAAADVTESAGIYTVNGGATEMTALPTSNAVVYVTYDYNNATSPIDLSGSKVYYIKDTDPETPANCSYLGYDSGSGWQSASWLNEERWRTADRRRQWVFEGEDPYKIYLKNIYVQTVSGYSDTKAYVRSGLTTSQWDDDMNIRFDVKDNSYKYNTFFFNTDNHIVAANNVWKYENNTNKYFYFYKGSKTSYGYSGSRSYPTGSSYLDLSTQHITIEKRPITVSYTLLTNARKKFITISGTAADGLVLPEVIQSPLVSSYHYYPSTAFADSNSDGIYEQDGSVAELDAASYSASEGENIYVIYDYDEDNAITFGSNTIHVDLTGKSRYTFNTRTEASPAYYRFSFDKRTLVASNDSYVANRNQNASDVVTWNDFYLWTFGYEDGGTPDPYAIVVKNTMGEASSHVLSPLNGVGGDRVDQWLIPEGASGDYIKTWALLTDNKLVARVPATDDMFCHFVSDGYTYQHRYDQMGTDGTVLLNAETMGYHVVNKSGTIALSERVPRQTTGSLSVPADLKSAHIIDDGQHYRYFTTQADAYAYSLNPTDETAIEHNQIDGYDDLVAQNLTEVYVGYHYDPTNIPEGAPELATSVDGATRYHVQIGTNPTKYWRATNSDYHNRPNFGAGGNELPAANYQWIFFSANSDPYDVLIKTPYYPNDYLRGAGDNWEYGNTYGAYSTSDGMYLNNQSGKDHLHSFFFTQSDIGVVVGVCLPPNRVGKQSYMYNHNNSYALLHRNTRGGDNRQLFSITKLSLFHVVNKAGDIAVSAYMPATSPLTVPRGLRTPLMDNSQYRFFTTQDKAAAYNSNPTDAEATAQGAITTAPATGAIYLGYNYVNNPDVLDLTGERWYNIKGLNSSDDIRYYYKNSTSTDYFNGNAAKQNSELYMFKLVGEDPYNVTIYNGDLTYNGSPQPLVRQYNNAWEYEAYEQRDKKNTSTNPVLSFLLLENEDGYATLAVHNKWYVNSSYFDFGEAGSDAYIGMKTYMHYLCLHDNRLRLANNDSYYQYYSDRSSWYTKLQFEPIKYETTFHIIDTHGREAIKYKGQFPAGMPLDFAHIPTTIRSPYLIDETLSFYSSWTSGNLAAQSENESGITQTPATSGTDVYVFYTTTHLDNKPSKLRGDRNYNVRINGDHYVFATDATIQSETTTEHKLENSRYWLLGGEDPYAMTIKNLGQNKYVSFDTSAGTLSVNADAVGDNTYFISMRNNEAALYEVMVATGSGVDAAETYYNIGRTNADGVKLFSNSQHQQGEPELQMQLSTNDLSARYYIIDKQKKVVIDAIDQNVELQVPTSISSPLVAQYHYWKQTDFSTEGTGENMTYTLTGVSELTNIASAGKDGDVYQIYVTYDVNDLVQFNGREKGAEGKMYMLKFSGGESFCQEDGADNLNEVATKAVYPYSNGDANLYIYGEEQWTVQQGNAATTRTRWPWYVVSANNDPYHVKIQSRTGQNGDYNYFRTYKPQDYGQIVTGVITESVTTQDNYVSKKQDDETDEKHAARVARQVPTEYMVLGTRGRYKLTTTKPIDDGSTNKRRTINSFEQYWKTYDTAKKNVLNVSEADDIGGESLVPTTPASYRETLTGMGWHNYKAWATAKRWNGYNFVTNTNKKGYEYLEHWYQTINMGEEFDFVEVEIRPALILIDNHGWEIMRKPLPEGAADPDREAKYAAIKPYDSPMVKNYYFWKKGSKFSGIHKFELSEQCMIGDDPFTSTSLTTLPPFEMARDADGRMIDWYVTYDVKEEYASTYHSALTEGGVSAGAFLVHQGSQYAMSNDGTSVVGTTVPAEAIENNNPSSLTDEMKWYLKPNYNIDTEMGYVYQGIAGAVPEAETKADLDAKYLDPANKDKYHLNGLDPYNLQIQNVEHGTYFKVNGKDAALDGTGGMTGTYATSPGHLSLGAVEEAYTADGHDHSTIHATNATFMAVDDGNGNIRLMPRFDHSHVVTNFANVNLQLSAAPAHDRAGAQTTIFTMPATYIYIIVDNTGHESIRYKGGFGDVSPSVPTHFQSPLAKDFKFYKNLTQTEGVYTEVASGDDISEKEITSTFGAAGLLAAENTVYVRYSFNPEGDKNKILSLGDWHTISVNGKPLWVNYADENNPTIPWVEPASMPATPGFEWQCKFIDNPDTEVPDPYNATTFNRVKPNKRWDIHWAILSHGDELAYLWARQGDYNYTFLSTGTATEPSEMQFYPETGFASDGTFDGTKSQITFGDVPDYPIEYRVITNEGFLALTAREPAARAYGEPSKPTAILPKWARSPVLNTEDFIYYVSAEYNEGTGKYTVKDKDRTTRLLGLTSFDDVNKKSIVYVRYNYNHETTPYTVRDVYFTEDVTPRWLPIDIEGNTWYNIVTYSWGTDWLYPKGKDSQGNTDYRVLGLDRPSKEHYPTNEGNFLFQSTKPYLWKLTGGDPYAVKLVNCEGGNDRCLSGQTADGTSQIPYLKTEADNPAITTFMILNPNNSLVLAATGNIKYNLRNTRWGADWIRYYEDVDDTEKENPYQGVSMEGYEFFKAPVVRNYTFHAMNCDDEGSPVETWSMKLRRDWLTQVKLQEDITRICAQYEKFQTHEFADLNEAGRGRFYSTEAMGDTDADRVYDETSGEYEVYPEIEEDETYHIYFRYKTKPAELAAYTSTLEQIASDAEYHKENGRLDMNHTGDAKWWFMVLDTDEDITATGESGSREFVGKQMFLRREDDGGVSWMNNSYALHKNKEDNYNNYSCHRLAEWHKKGDNDSFREGRWLWSFVGTDPYRMKLINMESAVGVDAIGEGVYSLEGAENCFTTITEKTWGDGSKSYPVSIPTEEPEENMLWGMAPGYGTENTFSLVAPIANERHQALFWAMNSSAKTDSVAGSPRAADRSNAIKLIQYEPVKYEDVNLVIRRNDEVTKYQEATAQNKPGILAGMTTGISKLYFAASERMFEAGDKIDMSDPETLPINVRRAFCNYTLYKDIYETIGGNYTVQQGPYPTSQQAYTNGAWKKDGDGNYMKDGSGNYIYEESGDKLYDEDGKPVWTYTADGTMTGEPAPSGAQSIYASYEVTSGIFLKTMPTQAEVAEMANENSHVFFMDFPEISGKDHHAYYDDEATFYIQTGNLKAKVDQNTGSWRSEKKIWNGSKFVDDTETPYNQCEYHTSDNRMHSVPQHLKWFFVGDPYKVQVFNTASKWNTATLKDKNGNDIKGKEAGKVAANLARFNPVQTNFQFVVDCVHMGMPDYSNIDTRMELHPTDSLGRELDPIPNRNVGKPYFNDFYWECVPAASDEEGTFALRFKEDNDLLGYRNVYYYLAHDGLTKVYLQDGKDHVTYHINLSYNPDNERHTSGDYVGYHKANDHNTVIKLVQPAKVYISAFKENNNGNNPISQWTPNPATGGMASSVRWTRKTQDELSEYYGLGETITEVPRHLQRKFVEYGKIDYDLIESNAYNKPLEDCADHTNNVFVTGIKVNPIFKLNVSYRVDDLTNTDADKQVHLFTTDAANPQWLDMVVSNNNWLYYDKTNRTGEGIATEDETDKVSNYRRAMSNGKTGWNNDADGWEDGLKGLHWAFIGDPYDFTILNRRRSEDAPTPDSKQYLSAVKATIADWKGTVPNDSVIWNATLTEETDAATSSTDIAAKADADAVSHFSTQMWKLGGNADYFLRTVSLKTGENDNMDGSPSPGINQTSNYWRLIANPDTREFQMVPFSLADRSRYTNNIDQLTYNNYINNDMGYSKTTRLMGASEQRLEIRTAVAKDEDNADNDCFDADVRIVSSTGDVRIEKTDLEIKYGDAPDVLPFSLRRYGCTYTCYTGYVDAEHPGTQVTDFDTDEFRTNVQTLKSTSEKPMLTYIYHVVDSVSQYFTTPSDAITEDYTWMNSYFKWDQKYSGTNVEVEYYEKVFDHYVYNSQGHIIDEVYRMVRKTKVVSNPTEAYPTTAYLNSHTNQTPIYADEGTQSEDDRQKWALVGDPYTFNMKNYAQYLLNGRSALILNGEGNIHGSNIDAEDFSIGIDKNGNSYLGVIDANGELQTFVSFDFSTTSDKHLKSTGTGANENDPTGNTLDNGGAKPFFLANLIRYADILQYHLVIAHKHSIDHTDTWKDESDDAAVAKKKVRDDHLLEYLMYQGIRKNNKDLYVTYDASGYPNAYIPAQETAIKELLIKNGTLRDYINNPIADYSVSRVGIGNHPQVPWYMKRQFCSYYLYQKDVMRSVTLDGSFDYNKDGVINDNDKVYAYLKNDAGQYVDYDGNVVDEAHRIQLYLDDAKTKPAYEILWVSISDKTYWDEWDSVKDGAPESNPKALKVGDKWFKKPDNYDEAIALNGKEIDKLQECHFNRKVLIDVVYEVTPEDFQFAYRDRNTTAWYQMMTNNASGNLLNFNYKDGIKASMGKDDHNTNDYLWSPEGDSYGFVLHNRYATINGTGWKAMTMTTTTTAENVEASRTSFDCRKMVHSGAEANAVYEMMTGDASVSNSFLMHPTTAHFNLSDANFTSTYLMHDTSADKVKLTSGAGSTLKTTRDANWRLAATAQQLWPYFKYSGYVGGLDADKAQSFTNQDYYNQLKACIEGGEQPEFTTLRNIQRLVYEGKFYDKDGVEVEDNQERPVAAKLPMHFVSDNLVNMNQNYFRIQGYSEDALTTAEGENGIRGPRYVSGYRFHSEIAGTKPLRYFETNMGSSTLHTFADFNTAKSYSDDILEGNIELLPADFDPSSIFYFQTASAHYGRYTLSTQGLNVQASVGSTTMSTADGAKFRIDDIGGAAVTMRTFGLEPAGNWDAEVVTNIQTNYLNSDSYALTLTAKNEMNETSNIQDTKWRLQPVGVHEEWPFNEMPLRVEMNKGGVNRSNEEDKYYYGSLYVPYDTRLGNTTDGAFTMTGTPTDGTTDNPGSVTLPSVSQLNEMGNPQFVPAAWPVVLRSNQVKSIVLKNKDDVPYATKKYVNMYLPNSTPTVISGALSGTIKLSGEYLEKQMTTDNTKIFMVFGLPFVGGKAHTTHEYDDTKQVGFFTNDNWTRESKPGYKAHDASYSAASPGTVATHGERSNKYVYHNKIYYVFNKTYEGPAPAPKRYAIAIFDDIDEEEEPMEPETNDVPWPCNVYDLQGRMVATNETPETLLKNHRSLRPGIYIFGGRKVVVK